MTKRPAQEGVHALSWPASFDETLHRLAHAAIETILAAGGLAHGDAKAAGIVALSANGKLPIWRANIEVARLVQHGRSTDDLSPAELLIVAIAKLQAVTYDVDDEESLPTAKNEAIGLVMSMALSIGILAREALGEAAKDALTPGEMQARSVIARTPWRDPARTFLKGHLVTRPWLSAAKAGDALLAWNGSKPEAERLRFPDRRQLDEWINAERRAGDLPIKRRTK